MQQSNLDFSNIKEGFFAIGRPNIAGHDSSGKEAGEFSCNKDHGGRPSPGGVGVSGVVRGGGATRGVQQAACQAACQEEVLKWPKIDAR